MSRGVLIYVLLILTAHIVCSQVPNESNNTVEQHVDTMENSAYAKQQLPWFARYQVGEPVVEGFPGETLAEKEQRMQWWVDAKYGLFLHWGPQKSGAEYELSSDELARFNPTEYDAEEWVLTAQKLGFKYMVITTRHHAGFSIFDSQYSTHDIVDATPFKRDPLKELADACAKYNMRLGFYYSVWDIHHPDFSEKLGSPNYAAYHQFMKNQVSELLTNYGPVATLWFDGEWVESWTTERANDLRDLVRELQPNTILANRIGQRRTGDGDHASPENFMPYIGNQDVPWEGCDKFDGSWFYNGTNKSKSVDWALYNLCYATSRGGNFLMNLGPTPEGVFLPTSVKKLEQIGEWLKVNGESIYGADKGPHYLLEWGTSTRKGNTLYYQIFDYPKDGKLLIPGLESKIKNITFLADDEGGELEYALKRNDVEVSLPLTALYALANVLKVELQGDVKVSNSTRVLEKGIPAKDAMREVPVGAYFLPAGFATIHGDLLHFYFGTGAGAQRENLKGWIQESDWVEWDMLVEVEGRYDVEITYASMLESGSFELSLAGQSFDHTVSNIGIDPRGKTSPLKVKYETFNLGEVNLTPGEYKLVIKPIKITEEAKRLYQGLMTLRDVTLSPKQ